MIYQVRKHQKQFKTAKATQKIQATQTIPATQTIKANQSKFQERKSKRIKQLQITDKQNPDKQNPDDMKYQKHYSLHKQPFNNNHNNIRLKKNNSFDSINEFTRLPQIKKFIQIKKIKYLKEIQNNIPQFQKKDNQKQRNYSLEYVIKRLDSINIRKNRNQLHNNQGQIVNVQQGQRINHNQKVNNNQKFNTNHGQKVNNIIDKQNIYSQTSPNNIKNYLEYFTYNRCISKPIYISHKRVTIKNIPIDQITNQNKFNKKKKQQSQIYLKSTDRIKSSKKQKYTRTDSYEQQKYNARIRLASNHKKIIMLQNIQIRKKNNRITEKQ